MPPPPRNKNKAKKTQENLTSDTQYNELLRAIQRSIASHKLASTAPTPQEEEAAQRQCENASKDAIAALHAFNHRPKAAKKPLFELTDNERRVTNKLYREIVAEKKRRQEDPLSEARPLPSWPEFRKVFGLLSKEEVEEEHGGWLPPKFTHVGDVSSSDVASTLKDDIPKPSKLEPLATLPVME